MNHFDYRNGVLHAEAVNLIELSTVVGTSGICGNRNVSATAITPTASVPKRRRKL